MSTLFEDTKLCLDFLICIYFNVAMSGGVNRKKVDGHASAVNKYFQQYESAK